jgi:hypothetical protein
LIKARITTGGTSFTTRRTGTVSQD